jgi:hypothetical protein
MITIITQYFSNLFSDAAWQVVQNVNETATKQMALCCVQFRNLEF